MKGLLLRLKFWWRRVTCKHTRIACFAATICEYKLGHCLDCGVLAYVKDGKCAIVL